jgi:cytochrome c5
MIRRLLLACGLGAVALVTAGGLGAVEAPAPAQRLPAPDHVSPETRSEIQGRMSRHGETMSNLVRSVVLLDRRTIRVLAGRIADEEVIARTDSARKRKRSLLPAAFFAAQEELSANARQLATAAKDGGDDKLLAERFAAVTRTCVTCHSAYLHGRPEAGPVAPKTSAAPDRK